MDGEVGVFSGFSSLIYTFFFGSIRIFGLVFGFWFSGGFCGENLLWVGVSFGGAFVYLGRIVLGVEFGLV